jgi:inorganic pyrophosphatase/exopolyphosphatase
VPRPPKFKVGEEARVERALDADARDGAIELPGVMSRKKQLAPSY